MGATPQAAGKPRAGGRSASHFRPRCRGAGLWRAAPPAGGVRRGGPSGTASPTTTVVPSLWPQPSVPGLPPAYPLEFHFSLSFPRPLFLFAGSGALEKEDKKGSGCEAKMEEAAQAPDWDSDETVIDGSVTESELEEEELPWRR